MRLVFYRDTNGKWRWTVLAENGKKLANAGEGYARRIDCVRTAKNILTPAIAATARFRRGKEGKLYPA